MGASPARSAASEPVRHGLRALVTRPQAEAAELAAALGQRGIAAVIEPLLDIRFRSEPTPDLTGVQAVLCTSANGVRALARLSPARRVPLLAVGEASAARARAEGFREVGSAAGDVDDLVRLAADRLRPQGGRLLHVAGSILAGDLAGALRQRGFTVERLVLYEACPAPGLSAPTARALSTGTIDYALFFSPRTAAIFARLVRQAALMEEMRFVTAVSISAAADAGLAALPFHDRHVTERPDQPHLLAALDDLLARRRSA